MVSVRHNNVNRFLESSLEHFPPQPMMHCLENVPCGVWNAEEEGQRSACGSVHFLIPLLISFPTIIQQPVFLSGHIFLD